MPTIQSLCELLPCFKIHLASLSSESEEIALVLDSTTDSNREVLAVFFAGKSEKEGIWSHSYGVIETRGYTAELQVSLVKHVLDEMNSIQVFRIWPF